MGCFRCLKCGCIENTAVSNYWSGSHLCSECDPQIGKWHGRFEKKSAIGMMQSKSGLLYTKKEIAPGGYFHRKDYLKREGPFTEVKS